MAKYKINASLHHGLVLPSLKQIQCFSFACQIKIFCQISLIQRILNSMYSMQTLSTRDKLYLNQQDNVVWVGLSISVEC